MKNLLFSFFLMIAFFYTSTAQETKRAFKLGLATFIHQEQEPQFIYGKVKEINYTAYHAEEVDGKIVNGERIKLSDVRSNLIWQSWSYQFNTNGQLIKLLQKDDDLNTELIGVVHYEEDKMKNIYWLYKDTLVVYHTFNYKANNQIEKQIQNAETGESYGSIVHNHNENGHLMAWERYAKDGQKVFWVDYQRDQKGHRISRTLHNKEGKETWKKVDYSYNDKGLPVTWHGVLNRGEKIDTHPTRKYEYDEFGNWTRLIHYGDEPDKQIRVVERSISFYE